MGKIHTTVSIDDELLAKAKNQGFNISGEFESALRKRFVSTEVLIPKADGEKCAFCGKIEAKATIDNLDGLTWLCPDEQWICAACLNNKARQVIISFGTANVMSPKKKEEIKELAQEFINQPEIRKDILRQMKKKITGGGKIV